MKEPEVAQCPNYKLLKTYFKAIFHPLNISEDDFAVGPDGADGDENVTVREKVTRLFRAVKDISHETEFGTLSDRLQLGLITDYKKADLDAGYKIYKDLIKFDIQNKAVTLDLLRISRDPESALKNVVEKVDPLDTEQFRKRRGIDSNAEVAEKAKNEVEGPDLLERIDGETLKQIAMYKSLCASSPDENYTKIAGGGMFEEELVNFINGGISENDIHHFEKKLKSIQRPPRCENCCQRVQEKAK